MKAVAHSSTRWPVIELRMRAQIVFWKSDSWRQHVQKCMRRLHPAVDIAALDHHCSVDMAKWRYQTLAVVSGYLATVREIAEKYVQPEWFQNTQERVSMHDFFLDAVTFFSGSSWCTVSESSGPRPRRTDTGA